ncbi:helix-turn-helix transcriptional regulator [Escherichia coli]
MSKKTGYSRRHIQNIFKNHFGISIGKYIQNRRLTNAALMIRFTKKRIIEIAIDLNYSSQQSFHRSFVNKFNCSPFKFRKINEIIVQSLTFPYNIV